MHRAISVFSRTKWRLAFLAVVLLLIAISFITVVKRNRPPDRPLVPISNQARPELHIVSVFRNIDEINGPVSIYFVLESGDEKYRIPSQGLVHLKRLEKVNIDYVFRSHAGLQSRGGRISLFDADNQRLGDVGFNMNQWPFEFEAGSQCEIYPYFLHNTYPFPQFPTYVRPVGARFRCFDSGKHYLEITVREILGDPKQL